MHLVRLMKQMPDLCRFNIGFSRFSTQSSDNNYAEYERRKFARRFGNIVRHHDKGFEKIVELDKDDFFGIKTFSADDVKGIDGLDDAKRQKLDKKVKELSNLQGLVSSEEGFLRSMSYGKVRYDHENKVDYMGQYEKDVNHILLEKKRRYMLEITSANETNEKMDSDSDQGAEQVPLNYIDQQYFDINTEKEDNQKQASKTTDLNFIDYQYFRDNYSSELTSEGFPLGPIKFQFTPAWNEYRDYLNSYDPSTFEANQNSPEQLIENLTFAGDTPLRSVEEVTHELILMKKNSQNDESQDSPENKEIKTEDHNNLTSEEVEDVPKTALDYITQIRKGQLLPEDKAYLEHLEKKFKKLVHRLDRDATGVLLLAKSLSMVKTLREMFSERKISKYYWAIVRGIPDPLNGIIDIPIEAGKTNGVERMHLKPDCDLDFNRKIGATRGAYPATTHFRTLRKWGNACLVELKPEQGIKHQIRVHLGFGLRTPILGDHKYSHLDKLAPQKLPDDMLLKLNVRQAKVRNIPLHLHSKLYIIPGIGMNGNNVSISAHLPGFFRANMSSLGLYKQEAVLKNPIAF
ncbi:uncharacterized protein LOC107369068 isoform X2 [Tetranychus urticae]|nr:uncharacterized protein LOC107369068 isoform X2 [Tetranychus urticae]